MNRGVLHLDVAASIPECSGKFRALTYIGSHPPLGRKGLVSCADYVSTGNQAATVSKSFQVIVV